EMMVEAVQAIRSGQAQPVTMIREIGQPDGHILKLQMTIQVNRESSERGELFVVFQPLSVA
ncbi:MAG TPA: hypothetical protein VG963_24760, partial [Polyangiaceae bacterium]|nr:hypothetical protein [Polyangiaceae bacterium]